MPTFKQLTQIEYEHLRLFCTRGRTDIQLLSDPRQLHKEVSWRANRPLAVHVDAGLVVD